jgi:hypothetical protein
MFHVNGHPDVIVPRNETPMRANPNPVADGNLPARSRRLLCVSVVLNGANWRPSLGAAVDAPS